MPSSRLDVKAPMSAGGGAPPLAVPDDPVDKAIRRDLNLAISRDSDLTIDASVSSLSKGDVSVSGTVGTEEERRRINDLAMNVPDVKSVANAVTDRGVGG